eukprot:1230340-Pyramimonas_sp.AAC.1
MPRCRTWILSAMDRSAQLTMPPSDTRGLFCGGPSLWRFSTKIAAAVPSPAAPLTDCWSCE